MNDASPETRRYIEEMRTLPVKPPKLEAKPKKPTPAQNEDGASHGKKKLVWIVAVIALIVLLAGGIWYFTTPSEREIREAHTKYMRLAIEVKTKYQIMVISYGRKEEKAATDAYTNLRDSNTEKMMAIEEKYYEKWYARGLNVLNLTHKTVKSGAFDGFLSEPYRD